MSDGRGRSDRFPSGGKSVLPSGYTHVRLERGTTVFVWDGVRDEVLDAVSNAGTLHSWALEQHALERLGGRGEARAVPAPAPGPDGSARWVVRHYMRGGAVASWLGDRYLDVGTPRPLTELRAAVEARCRGVPTPAVLAAAVYPAGLFYRADLVTEMVPNALDLATILFGSTSDRAAVTESGRTRALRAAAALVRTAADAGLAHPDVNAGNIVLAVRRGGGEPPGTAPRSQEAAEEATEAHLLDLDRCRVLPEGRRADADAMLRRLERSLDKLGARSGTPLGVRERETLWGRGEP